MSNLRNLDINTILQYKKTLAFSIGLIGMVLLDLTVSSELAFWITPLLVGILAGVVYGSAFGGTFAALGSMFGRLISTMLIAVTTPGMLRTGDLFLAAVGDVLGAPLPTGSLIIILLSMIISALFSYLGGTTGGSAVKLIRSLSIAEEE